MGVHHTAGLTAMWRHMANVDEFAYGSISWNDRLMGYLLGKLDPNSVETIKQRTTLIDTVIKTKKPSTIVEIGAGFSSRSRRFSDINVISLDIPEIASLKDEIKAYSAGDTLQGSFENALFIVEGVTMYLHEKEVFALLKEMKKHKGQLLISFFNREFSTYEKTLFEKLYKLIFRNIVGRKEPFSYRVTSIGDGISLLIKNGFRNVEYLPYNFPKTLDALFYGEF